MSGTASKKAPAKGGASKSTAGTDKETVAATGSSDQAKAEQEAELKAEAEAQAKAKEKAEAEALLGLQVAAVGAIEAKSKADAEAEAKTKQGNDDDVQLDSTKTTGDMDGTAGAVLGITGALKVRAKSAQGFWRGGVQFLRTKDTYLLVVDEMPTNQPATVAQDGIEPELVLFMSKEKAKRVHREPNLVVEVVELSEVIDIEDMA